MGARQAAQVLITLKQEQAAATGGTVSRTGGYRTKHLPKYESAYGTVPHVFGMTG